MILGLGDVRSGNLCSLWHTRASRVSASEAAQLNAGPMYRGYPISRVHPGILLIKHMFKLPCVVVGNSYVVVGYKILHAGS